MSGSRWAMAVALVLSASRAWAAGPAEAPRVLHLPTESRSATQGILRPVPLTIELPEALAVEARRVLLYYRVWGDPDWSILELRRGEARWSGAIPCLEVSTIAGDLRYYFRVHDLEGRVIATAGSRAEPFVVVIRHDTAPDAAPDERPRCPEPTDCPRGLPGCPSEVARPVRCTADADCEGDDVCGLRGVCERDDRRHAWLSVGAAQELGLMATRGACALAAQENEGTTCLRDDGSRYLGDPVYTNTPLAPALGPTRVALGYDHLIAPTTSLGVRVSWVLRGEGPTAPGATRLVPVGVAGRVTHWIGDDPFAQVGWRPYIALVAGYAMSDFQARSRVREDVTVPPQQGGNDLAQRVTVWRRAGDALLGAAGGVAVGVAPGHALDLHLQAHALFPFGALVVAPGAGWMVGF